MHARKTVKRAFTLVEILIVVVILGILAAIVVPQFAKAADDARAGNIQTQLSTIQNAIELYRAREGAYPTMTDWDDLLGDTDGDGVYPDGNATQYLKEEPRNPAHPVAASRVLIAPTTNTGQAGTGWVYNTDDDQIYASYFDEDPDSGTGLQVTPTVP